MARPILPGFAALLILCVGVADATPTSLPLKLWVKRPLPASGEGACPYGCKHMRLTPNPVDGRIYFCGGDYSADGPFLDSGRNEIYSYSIADSSWRLEHPYCAPLGQVQPSHPDEVGWVYDTRRNIFWMIPGYMGAAGGADGGLCPDTNAMKRWEIMTFHPATGRWTLEPRQEVNVPTLGNDKFAQYDPVTDTIIQFYYDSFPGVAIYDIASDTWTKIRFTGIGNAVLDQEYSAMDLVDRVIYVLDGNYDLLYRYNMDARTMTQLGPLPADAEAAQTRIAWDSVSRVLLWAKWGGSGSDPASFGFYAYHPTGGSWETLPTTLAEDGGQVYGNCVTYDPGQNAFVLIGGAINPSRPYFYLFRYGNGSGPPPPPDTIPPSAPQDLRPR